MIIKIDKKTIFYIFIGTVLALVLCWFCWVTVRFIINSKSSNQTETSEKTTYMTVFIHGSFGSLLGLLNLGDVLNDKVSGTLYHNTTKKMRADDIFFKDQPLLQRGLVPVTPTFDLEATNNKKYAVYPLAAAYQMIANIASKGKEENLFYTFGWSGLMSQGSRRFEAIRLYNALYKELEILRARGLNPKIRLITHSHGGNLALNLEAINRVMNEALWANKKTVSKNHVHHDQEEALQKMAEIIKGLTTQEEAAQRTGQKALDYVPVGRNLIIDELVLFGVPIQPETEAFCYSDTFKRVYNFYSHEDLVQKMDWVSSKQPLSNQRIRDLSPRKRGATQKTSVIQAQLMIDRTENEVAPISKLHKEPTVIDEVAEGRNIFVRTSKDPTHKELWFVSWQDDTKPTNKKDESILMPLPIVVLTPLLEQALKQSGQHDARLNIHQVGDDIIIDVVGLHRQKNVVSLKRSVIDEIIKKLMLWKPEDITPEKELDAILKHLS